MITRCAGERSHPPGSCPAVAQRAAVDDHSARATVVDGPPGLSLLFRFNDAGLIGSFRAEARASMVDQVMVMAQWEGCWSNYVMRDGMQVPSSGEVALMLITSCAPRALSNRGRGAKGLQPS